MAQSLDARLDEAIRRRDAAAGKKQRLEGKLEAARAALATVEKECRERGVEPDKIPSTIDQLEARYRGAVEELERLVAEADQALAPYIKES